MDIRILFLILENYYKYYNIIEYGTIADRQRERKKIGLESIGFKIFCCLEFDSRNSTNALT